MPAPGLFKRSLKGHRVVILPDNDDVGRSHAERVKSSCLNADEIHVRIINLPALPVKGDVSDWAKAGGTREELLALVNDAFAKPPVETENRGERLDPKYWRRTEDGLAEEFIRRYGDDFKFIFDLSKDLKPDNFAFWNGCLWVMGAQAVTAIEEKIREMTAEYFDYANGKLRACGGVLEAADKDTREAVAFKKHIESTRFRSGWKQQIKSYSQIHKSINEFDLNPTILPVANGVIDLTTGALRKPRREDYVTRASPISYDPNASCTQWERFLKDVFLDNKELIGFIQRAVGYSLTGDIREQCLFICIGAGANGKSTYLNLISHILGPYACTAVDKTFMQKAYDSGINNDLAKLKGVRMVAVSETNEGKHIDEALIKRVTGGDSISARFLRQEYFEFIPAFKLWFTVNHEPRISGTDEGIWRRLIMILFQASFHGARQDKNIEEKLKTEASGILAWAVQGALLWRSQGLNPPSNVLRATAEYRNRQDVVGGFIEEKCERCDEVKIPATDLYNAYLRWCEIENIEAPLNQTRFGCDLKRRGIYKEKTGGVVYRLGVRLKECEEDLQDCSGPVAG